MTLTRDGRLDKVIARGGKLSADVADRIVSGSVSLSSTESDQLTMTLVDDADLNVLASRLFDAGTPTSRGSRLDFGGLRFEVRAVEVTERGTDAALVVTARSLGTARLKRDRGAHVWRNVSPTGLARKLAKEAGLTFVGQPTGKRKNIRRAGPQDGEPLGETSWDVITRLASEAGFLAYETGGVLHFGKPSWLVENLPTYPVRWAGAGTSDDLDAMPTCRRSGDDAKRLATVRARLRGDKAEALTPGRALDLTGVPTFEGRYLIDSITIPLLEHASIDVNATTPIDPEKVARQTRAKAPTTGGTGGTTTTAPDGTTAATGATGAKSAAAFVALCLAQAGDTYIYGAEASVGDPNPNAFDCSELIEWAAARVGVPFPGTSSSMIAAARPVTLEAGIATRGALLWHPGHIAISLGDGRTIEAANPSAGVTSYGATGRFQRAGLIPGLRY